MIMHLGKDFWWVIKIVEFFIKFLTAWSKDNNEDTPAGEV
ncbi:unnamed protein product [marine sediment metagenome]|uniref:Uncharacterized protein n=1 Tax=marine sediment metagenome TaxID=412755 RepID=X1JN32_9ZZZZ